LRWELLLLPLMAMAHVLVAYRSRDRLAHAVEMPCSHQTTRLKRMRPVGSISSSSSAATGLILASCQSGYLQAP
jgi:hypothetical protein